MAQKKKMSLTLQIVLAMVAGFLFGWILNVTLDNPKLIPAAEMSPLSLFFHQYVIGAEGLLSLIGSIFVKSLKMMVVPLVFVSLVCGVCSLSDIRQLGRLGFKTLALYLATTAIAISAALVIALLVAPGKGFDLPAEIAFQAKEAPSLYQVILNIFPSNPIQSMATGNMLQVIVSSLLFGVAIALVGERGRAVGSFFEQLNEVIMKLVTMLMIVAPIGVFCLLAKVFATQGFDAVFKLGKYFLVVLFVLFVHALVTYPLLLKLLSGLNPLSFFRDMRAPIMFGFSTASSSATMPVTLESVEHRLGVKNSVASFTIPLGATVNMDGTAIMQGCATIFIAQAYNIDIPLSGYLMVILTATLASVGTAGVPGVGLITLATVLTQAGLPIEGIGLIIGVDRLLDMTRTAVNIVGDATVTCIVAKSEGALDETVFNANQPLQVND